jgi:hypothetical protein
MRSALASINVKQRGMVAAAIRTTFAQETEKEELAGPRLAATKSELTDALHGRVRPHHQFLIGQHLKLSSWKRRLRSSMGRSRYEALPGPCGQPSTPHRG